MRGLQEERNSSPQSSVPEQSEDAWQLEPWSWDPQVRRAQQAELRRIIGSGVARPSDRVASHGALTDNLVWAIYAGKCARRLRPSTCHMTGAAVCKQTMFAYVCT